MDYDEAKELRSNYVSSVCWGELFIEFTDKTYNVHCTNCIPGDTFVTRRYAERRRAESVFELQEAEKVLTSIGVLQPKPKRSPEQIIKDLGF